MFFKLIAEFIKKFLFLINILFGVYTLLVYQLVYSANIQHWIGGFISLSFPLVIIGNLLFVFIWLVGRSPKTFLSIGILLLALPLHKRTFRLGLNTAHAGQSDLTVLSYNVMYLDYPSAKKGKASKDGKNIVAAMNEITTDIKCFQELYNNKNVNDLDVISKITEYNPHYVYMHSQKGNDKADGTIGLATFSKYPIINKEEIYWKTNNNGLLATDIVIKEDTIRIINFQLRSMGIRVERMFDENRKINKKETKNILSQLKDGFESRGQEVATLENMINESPYPIIAVGDLNEMPYGYAYGKLKSYLNNAFEDAGKGFGFTYHEILRFLRIDNQFYDTGFFKATKLSTLKKHKSSDHYPVVGEYQIL